MDPSSNIPNKKLDILQLIDSFPLTDSYSSDEEGSGHSRRQKHQPSCKQSPKSSYQPNLESKTAKAKTNSRISFEPDEKTQVHLVPQVKDMVPDEIHATWYTRAEIKAIKATNRLVRKSMKRNKGDKDGEYKASHCYRGLRSGSDTIPRARSENIYKSIYVTLSEQKRQKREDIDDPDALAAVYRGLTIFFTLDARRMAKFDEAAAAKVFSGEDDEYDSEPEIPAKESSKLTRDALKRHNSGDIKRRRNSASRRRAKRSDMNRGLSVPNLSYNRTAGSLSSSERSPSTRLSSSSYSLEVRRRELMNRGLSAPNLTLSDSERSARESLSRFQRNSPTSPPAAARTKSRLLQRFFRR